MYGMIGKVPVRGLVAQSVRKAMEAMYAPGVVVPDLTKAAGDGVAGRLMEKYGPQLDAVLDGVAAARARLRGLRRR